VAMQSLANCYNVVLHRAMFELVLDVLNEGSTYTEGCIEVVKHVLCKRSVTVDQQSSGPSLFQVPAGCQDRQERMI
jgi:hypothetical protein